jgi:hypothetical protein
MTRDARHDSDGIAPRTRFAGFVPRDPYAAGCLIELRGDLADEALTQGADVSARI